MDMKSRTFSIYLLKNNYSADNALKKDNPLTNSVQATKLPPGARMYLLNSIPYPPWWKDYWGIVENIEQSLKGAIAFIPSGNRFFALTFGHTYHYLKEDAYEYDFGLKITLNSIDPNKLKSTDTLNPENFRRQRTQSPTGSDITFFDFDRDSSIIRHLTGKVKREFKDIFSNTTGASSLTVSIKKTPCDIPSFLSQLLDLYTKDDYKQAFPSIHNIVPLHDPIIIKKLNEKIIEAFIDRRMYLVLSIPDIIDYDIALNVYFSGAGQKQSKIYPDVYIDDYREYLKSNSKINVTIEDLKKHSMNLCDEDGKPHKSYSVYKSLLFDCNLDNEYFHLCEGNWYKIDSSYIAELHKILDPYFYEDKLLPDYKHNSENDYNTTTAKDNKHFICLDKTNISPTKQTDIEPCDLLTIDDETKSATFYHVKLSTRSSTLSHLF